MKDEEYKPVARQQGPAPDGNETLKGAKDAGLLFRQLYGTFSGVAGNTEEKSESRRVIQIRAH